MIAEGVNLNTSFIVTQAQKMDVQPLAKDTT